MLNARLREQHRPELVIHGSLVKAAGRGEGVAEELVLWSVEEDSLTHEIKGADGILQLLSFVDLRLGR